MKDTLDIVTDEIIDADQYIAVTLKDKTIQVHASLTEPTMVLALYAASLRNIIETQFKGIHPALFMHELTKLVLRNTEETKQ